MKLKSMRSVLLSLMVVAALPATAWSAITGNVFQDFNSNGVKDVAQTIPNQGAGSPATIGIANDKNLQGVQVRAYCVTDIGADGILGTSDDNITAFPLAGPVLTDSSGNFNIATSGVVAATAPRKSCRIEFTWDATTPFVAPANVQPNPLFGLRPTFVGSGSNTATQFVNDGDVANLGLNYPSDFCQNNPTLVTNCMRFGASGGQFAADTAVNGFPYNAKSLTLRDANGNEISTTNSPTSPTQLAKNSQVGSTWGLAHHKPQNKVLVGAYLKRNIGIGPGGLGQIYSIDATNTTAQTVTNFLNLEVLKPGSAGPNPRVSPAPAAGTSPTDPSGYVYSTDNAVLVGAVNGVGGDLKTGKLGIGDIDVSDDQRTLYAIGLNSRKLYIIPVGVGLTAPTTGSAVTEVSLPDPGTVSGVGCPADTATPAGELNLNLRPFALKASRGVVYVGLTCTAEGAGGTDADLRAFVYRYNGGTSFTQVANTSLNYNLEGGLKWNRWTDAADSTGNGCCFQVPEPLLTDIEFSPAGDMILGIRDRMGDATGRGNFALNSSTNTVDGRAHGDIIRACYSAANGRYDNANCVANGTWSPTGARWFTDGFPDPNNPMGGLVQVPGFPDVVTTAKDPSRIYSSGVAWYSTTNGTGTKGYEILNTGGNAASQGNKSSNMGDIEALCDAAPLEVGNRLWLDTNGNGIQDPGEPPLVNVTVRLYSPTGALLATALTDSDGQYAFSNRTQNADGSTIAFPGAAVATTGTVNAIPGFNTDTTGYSIRVDNPSDYLTGAPLANLKLTKANATGVTNNDVLTDLTDSDATLPTPTSPIGTGNYPRIDFDAGGPGENNFGLDVGFIPVYSLGNRVWFDINGDGILNNGENPIPGVAVELLNASGQKLYRTATGDVTTTAAGNTVITANTDPSGYYRFDNLPTDSYSVRVSASNWTPGTGVLAGYSNSTFAGAGASNGADNPNGVTAVNNTDKGIDNPAPATNGIVSRPVYLGVGNQPLNDVDSGATGAGANGPAPGDANDNLTVDFGFNRLTIGNTVWRDDGTGGGTANNGIKEASEPGIDGVRVELLDSNNNVIAVTTTSGGGQYLFNQTTNGSGVGTGNPIPPGTYTVRIPAGQSVLNGLNSSGDPAGVSTPLSADSDDNGPGSNPGTLGVTSSPFALALGNNAATGAVANNATATTDQPRVDFGFTPTYSLGNRIWFDTNNNGSIDGGEQPVPGVKVELLDNTGARLYRSPSGVITTSPAGNTPLELATDPAGYYRFDNLPANGYQVRVAASNFAPGSGPLAGYASSTGVTGVTSGTGSTNNNDKGVDSATPATTGITSGTVTLGPNQQPTGDKDAGATGAGDNSGSGDANDNLTVDFGFYKLSIGNTVWLDNGNGGGTANNGTKDGSEPGIAGVRVELYKGGTLVAVTTTDANGQYLFTQQTDSSGAASGNPLQPGADYQVRIPGGQTALNGLSSSADPAGGATPLSADNDDNGQGTSLTTGVTSSANFTLGAGAAAGAGAVADNATGTTDQPRVDFGFVAPYSIGNRVWIDNGGGTPGNANNGVVDAGEPAAPAGVTMQLLDSTGAPLYRTSGGALTTSPAGNSLATTTTNGAGYYRFDGLPAGGYQVRIAASNFTGSGPLVGYLGSTGQSNDFTSAGNNRDHGSDGATPATTGITSDTVNVGGATPAVTGEVDSGALGAGGNGPNGDAFDNLTVDFGLVPPPLSLGNRVWNDANNNGVLDNGESGIGNATMYLYVDNNNDGVPDGNPIASKTTDGNGYYLFTGLAPGNYIVGVDPSTLPTVAGQAPFKSSTGQNGSATGPYEGAATPDPDTNVDSDDNGSLSNASNASGTSVPMVLSKPVTLASNSEPTAETDIGPQADTAANPSSNLTVDFGFFRPASLGDFVWLDKNANGVQDSGETGIPGATVNLYKAGVLIATTTTGANGDYKFDNLIPGTDYEVEFVKPPGYSRSPKDDGGDDSIDSDANVTTGRTGPISLTVGQNRTDVDAGLFFTASLGDRVWFDTNRNGIQDAGEAGVPGVQVTLTTPSGGSVVDINGNPVTPATTDANGNYNFPNLIPGSYVVTFVPSTLPAGYQFTTKGSVGTKDAADSDADPVTGKTETIALVSNENDPTWDAGIYKREIDLVLVKDQAPVAPANGTPWVPGNRIQYTVIVTNKGPDDAQAGWVVSDTLPAALINPTLDNVSPAAANCSFAGNVLTCTGTQGIRPDPVVAGINTASLPKQVAVTYSAEIGPSASGAITNSAQVRPNPSDPAETVPLTAPNTNNRSSQTINLTGIASLGNFVWIDSNGNGVQNAGEPGVAGVTVSLFDSSNNLVGTTTTDGNGFYQFNNLTPSATYTVSLNNPANFATGGPLAGYGLTTPNVGDDALDSDATYVAGVPAITGATTGAAGTNTPTYDFGFIPPASLGDRVWFDTDRNGVQDAGELGVPGVTVTLYDSNGNALRTTTTDGNGNYLFTGLTPGVPYSVGFSNLPTGYVFSPQDAGSNDGVDSDVNPATGRTAPVTLGPGEVRLTLDAGINQPPIAPVMIGNFVWRDTNSDGIQDAGEPGVAGVTVTVVRVDGNPVTDPAGNAVPTTTTTDGSGTYTFSNLAPGQYRVSFSNLPVGLVPTITNAPGSLPGNDSNGLTATSAVLTAGQSDLTLDLGLIVPPVVGGLQGTVFLDPNRNGTRDTGESAVPAGTLVQLINPTTGAVVATVPTDVNGNYVFTNVTPGTYDVRPVPPAGTVATTLAVQRVGVVAGVTTTAPVIGFATPEPIPTLSFAMLLMLAALIVLFAGMRQRGAVHRRASV
jgi:protocatechuate 3,4-dioxygenase beta subunit